MSAPKATEAAVAAVQQALGCIRESWPRNTSPAWCDTHWEEGDDAGSQWTERGCPVAVAAADAAAPHNAAQTLRGHAADLGRRGYRSAVTRATEAADRIEVEP